MISNLHEKKKGHQKDEKQLTNEKGLDPVKEKKGILDLVAERQVIVVCSRVHCGRRSGIGCRSAVSHGGGSNSDGRRNSRRRLVVRWVGVRRGTRNGDNDTGGRDGRDLNGLGNAEYLLIGKCLFSPPTTTWQ